MKLPPVALTAPTLCPRCDAPALTAGPALTLEHCVQCDLQLRQCGSCRGVAGPFDRFCGFCGYEILRGSRRLPLRPLWLLVVLVPLAAALAYGAAVYRGAISAQTAPRARATAEMAGAHRSGALGVSYLPPPGWTVGESATGGQAEVVMTRERGDLGTASGSQGDLLANRPAHSAITISRPPPAAGQAVSEGEPVAVLTAEVTTLLAKPPGGVSVEVTKPVHSLTVGGRPAAAVTLKLTRDGSVSYLERTLVASGHQGAPPIVRVDAVAPEGDWQGGDQARIEQAITALRFG